MYCPQCNAPVSATDVHCLNCRATLILEAVSRDPAALEADRKLDFRKYSGMGFFFGFFLSVVILKNGFSQMAFQDRFVYGCSLGGGMIGSFIGRLFAKSKWDMS